MPRHARAATARSPRASASASASLYTSRAAVTCPARYSASPNSSARARSAPGPGRAAGTIPPRPARQASAHDRLRGRHSARRPQADPPPQSGRRRARPSNRCGRRAAAISASAARRLSTAERGRVETFSEHLRSQRVTEDKPGPASAQDSRRKEFVQRVQRLVLAPPGEGDEQREIELGVEDCGGLRDRPAGLAEPLDAASGRGRRAPAARPRAPRPARCG